MAGERRQLTVMFCDLVGSTPLSARLDPEDLREVVRNYQATCAEVIHRYEGHIAQYLGDGLLVYFGYPTAHEDDAARMQGEATPDTVVISPTTYQLVTGLFTTRSLGVHHLKGAPVPMELYQVLAESEMQHRFAVAVTKGLTPLVGRDEEVGLLLKRWEQAKEGRGQVVLLSGEPGIGKSRLVQVLKDRVATDGSARLEARCSPYHQNSAFYPLIDFLQRTLQFQRDDSSEQKFCKLEAALEVGATGRSPLSEAASLFASLLSLPLPDRYPPLNFTPQKLKEKTLQATVSWLLAEAEQRATLSVWEDLQWADPSTVEFLTLLLEQVPTTKLLVVLTYRPEFVPPWTPRSHLTPLVLSRLAHKQIEEMVAKVTVGEALPMEVVQQIVSKTDGVPLFVEELTKMVLESGLYVGATHASPLLGIPATLRDALMARLDRLNLAKEVAQLGATLGREFSYDLIHAVSPLDETSLQQALTKLGEAEILYQRGLPPQTHYIFKHALIQDAAYQSLLKSTRQRYHQQIARVLEERFAQIKETQPELLAHHYTEAGLIAQAIPYWQQAGERAVQRSAYVEAISHLTKGLEVLNALPDTPERVRNELTLQLALCDALVIVKGYTASDVEKTLTRARELCQHLGETPQLVPVLWRLASFYIMRREFQTTLELSERLMRLAQSGQDPYLLSVAHGALGITLYQLGELVSARPHLEQAITLYDPQKHPRSTVTADPRVDYLSFAAWTLWLLGYPDQGLKRNYEALTLAEELSHPFSLAYALGLAAVLHLLRREGSLARERAEAAITLSTEQGFPYWLAVGMGVRDCALAEQGQVQEGIAQMRQSRAPFTLALLARAYGKLGQVEEGLTVLAEALDTVNKTGERVGEAELHRLKGELVLQSGVRSQNKSRQVRSPESEVPSTQPLTPSTQAAAAQEAEGYFLKAIEVAHHQQAKSLELRAVMSLSRLWQQQDKKKEAHRMLAEIYHWFTEGFDTKDLQEAKTLLEDLA